LYIFYLRTTSLPLQNPLVQETSRLIPSPSEAGSKAAAASGGSGGSGGSF